MKKNKAILLVFICLVISNSGQVLAATTVAKWKDNKKAAFTFTFDDSNSSEAAIAIPYLIKKGLVASWYIVPGKSTYTSGSCNTSKYFQTCNCSDVGCPLSNSYECTCNSCPVWTCKSPNCFKQWESELVGSGQDLANHTWEHGWTSCSDAEASISRTREYILDLYEQ